MSFSRRARHFLIRKKGGRPTAPRVATECQIVLEEFKPRGFGQGDAALGLEDEVAQSRPTESRGPGNVVKQHLGSYELCWWLLHTC